MGGITSTSSQFMRRKEAINWLTRLRTYLDCHTLSCIKRNGCHIQQLAAQAGLGILKKGGNAVDAALVTAVCLTVVEPTSNGLGSDMVSYI